MPNTGEWFAKEHVLNITQSPWVSTLDAPSELLKMWQKGFPGGAVVENLPANTGDTGSSPGLGGSHMPWSIRPVSHNY